MNTNAISVSPEPTSRIYFNEVVTRDGFQNESVFIDTDDKVALIDALSECGYAKIEVTSFTSAKAIPMLRDAEAVMQRVRRVAGVEYSVLVPNMRGAERALECRPDELNLVMSCSESHSLANLRMPRQQSLQTLLDVVRLIRQMPSTHAAAINVSLSCVFGCPIEGTVPLAEVQKLVQTFVDAGVRGITLCDTTGMAHPAQVKKVCDWALQAHPQLQWTLHFHNTRGMGLANVLAAVQSGVHRFDGSLGGLGGCPYAPGATGNICSEDALHMLQAMGFDTGVNLQRLLLLARALPDLVGHALSGQVAKAGSTEDLHPMPCQA